MDQGIVCVSSRDNPFENIATERLLMDKVALNEQIMFLWQNTHTIVIGRNQNAFQECRVEEFERSGGHLARRLSGGGAVYHDTGNLNFTFISPKETYDVGRNMSIICDAVRSFGLDARTSGRNDIEIDGAKFSGNAFYTTKLARCHHGTLMIDVDTEKLSRYLQPDPRKLQTRGVASVKSRVVNLRELESTLTVATLTESLTRSFSDFYGAPVRILSEECVDQAQFEELREHLASSAWRYGKKSGFDRRSDHRYLWGGIDLRCREVEGTMREVVVFSDALDAEFIDALTSALEGAVLESSALDERIRSLMQDMPSCLDMLEECRIDIINDLRT